MTRAEHEDLWAHLTTFIASATVGLVIFNFFRIIGLHRASLSETQQQPVSITDLPLQLLLETRVCGSPAVDAYAHVNVSCILQSPTARWYRQYTAAGGSYHDLVVHIEPQADYDGVAVKWGINHKRETAQECAKACWKHRPGQVDGAFRDLPCNAFTFCGAETCFEPDKHKHTRGDCWLKFTEAPASPEVNMRGRRPDAVLARHPAAPIKSQWVSGVLLPPGVQLRNGSWSPRYYW